MVFCVGAFEFFLQRAGFHEGEKGLIYRCMPIFLILTISFFLLTLFSLLFLLSFLFPSPSSVPPPFCSQQDPPFIVSDVTRFYCFNPQLPLSGLGVLADHHCSICVSSSHRQTRKCILFASLPWHPFLPRSGLFLSPYPSWHAPNGSNSVCLF